MYLKSLDVSTHMDRSLSFGVERWNSSSELVFRVCFLMCLWPRRKIWTVTKGDIHRKLQRSVGQLARFFFPWKEPCYSQKKSSSLFLNGYSSSQTVKTTFENKTQIFLNEKEPVSWGQGGTEGGRKGIFKMLRLIITKPIKIQCVNSWFFLLHPSQAGHKKNYFS